MPTAIHAMSAAELSAAYATKKLSPVEATEAFLRRIEALDSAINAFCLVDRAAAGAQARAAEARWQKGAPLSPLDGVRGLAFVAFPLHPAGAPGVERAHHLADVTVPILFLQGTRDKLAELHLLRSVVETLGPRATLHVVDDADHSLHVRASSGRTDAKVVLELARTMSACRPPRACSPWPSRAIAARAWEAGRRWCPRCRWP